jgi:hypothetical protein
MNLSKTLTDVTKILKRATIESQLVLRYGVGIRGS